MTSLRDVRRLARLGDQRRLRCEQQLLAIQRVLEPLEAELRALEGQRVSLKRFLASERPEACHFSHGELMALLRRQAVVRRQLDELDIERVRVDDSRRKIAERLECQRLTHRALLRKQDKYRVLDRRLTHGLRLQALRREEHDMEEAVGIRSGGMTAGTT